MTSERFWSTIAESRPGAWDPSVHAENLTELLTGRGVDDTIAFAGDFQSAIDELNTWDLWGAAYLAMGGCSDDSFEYVRCWIVAQGRTAWEQARHDPESYFVRLLGSSDSPEDRWERLQLHSGEPLLYAAGIAHERLTGSWTPAAARATEPRGLEWDEDDLPSKFPRLRAALPADWWDTNGTEEEENPPQEGLLGELLAGLDAIGRGDHDTSQAFLEPMLDDPDKWREVVDLGLGADVGYSVGITRLLNGDMSGARDALEAATAVSNLDHVRRGLAQVELAVGALDAARTRLDLSEDSHRLDRALSCLLAQRAGDVRTATDLALAVLEEAATTNAHPWDVAGAVHIAGHVLVEVGHSEGAAQASSLLAALIADAPRNLPLVAQSAVLGASVARMLGDADSAHRLVTSTLDDLRGAARGHAFMELARSAKELDRHDDAATHYASAAAVFDDSGETWLAAATRREAEGSSGS